MNNQVRSWNGLRQIFVSDSSSQLIGKSNFIPTSPEAKNSDEGENLTTLTAV